MANLLWGKVFYKHTFAGFLREEPGDRYSFSYDESYLGAGLPAIAHTLPLRPEPHINQAGLHPFFDNLVAEGWLEEAQTRLLGKRQARRFELLLAFGTDCAGAVSIVDPDPAPFNESMVDINDPKEMAVMTGRSSLSGIQPKLALIEEGGALRPAKINELSTHIAKFPSRNHDDLVMNEYLTTLAYKALMPRDDVVDLQIGQIKGFDEPALIIKRFDRKPGNERVHFEEFNQLLGYPSQAKYDGSHKIMADFIKGTENCLGAEIFRLYQRIIAGFLLGNTDMHLKNFAMFHTPQGLRLAPVYDQVGAFLYGYKTVALGIAGANNMPLGSLKSRHLVALGEEFGLSKPAMEMAFKELAENLEEAKEAIQAAKVGNTSLKDNLTKMMDKKWNGTFALTGKALSKKR